MWIKDLKIKNFRNYENEEIKFDKNINIFYGNNAQGKTNIIEAIFLGSMGKSFRTNKDREMIRIGKDYNIVEIEYQKEDREGTVRINISNKKNIMVNGIKINKLSELLGKINIVIFTPDDINILKGMPQNRRKFLDIMISQLRPNYMNNLKLYNKSIEQRNKYLRQIKEENKSEMLLDVWDEKIAEYANNIAMYRNEYIKKIKDKIVKIHNEITDNKEKIEIDYISDCINKNEYLEILKKCRKMDIIKGFTSKGIHRDDFVVYINGKRIDTYGSQGQNRTAILSLKITELEIIKEDIGEFPILLLDDFMSELDEERRNKFLNKIENIQVIITCTHKITIENKENLIYNVKEGRVIKGGN